MIFYLKIIIYNNNNMNINVQVIKNDDVGATIEITGDYNQGLHVSIINGIRRTLLTSVPSVAFRKDDIKIITNNTSMHNELLQQRIGLIPLYIDPENYNKNYLFELNIKNTISEPFLQITSEDFNIYPIKKNVLEIALQSGNTKSLLNVDKENYESKPVSKEIKDNILRPFIYNKKKNYCLITELKSTNSDDNIQEIQLYGSPSLSIAMEDARWQGVSNAVYEFKRDEELFKKILNEKIEINNVPKENIKEFSRDLYISESERYYLRDKNFNPYVYLFTVSSQHHLSHIELFIKANNILINTLNDIKNEFIHYLKDDISIIDINNNNHNIFNIKITGFDDTIGNLLQSFIAQNLIDDNSKLNVCGYKKIHPLEEIIIFNVSINPENSLFNSEINIKTQQICEEFMNACDSIISIYENILSSF